MAVTLNASTSSGFIATSDTSGSLELQANGTTKATVGSTGLSIGQYNPSASLITSGTAVSASSTSVDFTSIPSWVKRITVMFNGVSTSGTSAKIIQLGDSGGIETSGYSGTGTVLGNGSGTSTAMSSGFFASRESVATDVLSGQATISLLNSATNTWAYSGVFGQATATAIIFFSGGAKATSATLDRIRITTANGTDTFDAGTINILYE
jgi:hypothetical protein